MSGSLCEWSVAEMRQREGAELLFVRAHFFGEILIILIGGRRRPERRATMCDQVFSKFCRLLCVIVWLKFVETVVVWLTIVGKLIGIFYTLHQRWVSLYFFPLIVVRQSRLIPKIPKFLLVLFADLQNKTTACLTTFNRAGSDWKVIVFWHWIWWCSLEKFCRRPDRTFVLCSRGKFDRCGLDWHALLSCTGTGEWWGLIAEALIYLLH